LREVRAALAASGAIAIDAALSPLRGPSGNVEFFFRLSREGVAVADERLDELVARAHESS
jgi:hypothetical protein